MTDSPRVGILCCGKPAVTLSSEPLPSARRLSSFEQMSPPVADDASVHTASAPPYPQFSRGIPQKTADACADTASAASPLQAARATGRRLAAFLRKSGYTLGGFQSYTVGKTPPDELLFRMCLCNNLVLSVGCDGFSRDDILPDATSRICTRGAPFFALHACGVCNIRNYDNGGLACRTSGFPSRATAGICSDALVINLPSDADIALSRLEAVLPMIDFALIGLCGKSVGSARETDRVLCAERDSYLSAHDADIRQLFSRYQSPAAPPSRRRKES